jgi:hypothetical protein
MTAVAILSLAMGGPGPSGDLFSPDVLALRLRLLLVKKGMSQREVHDRLGLKGENFAFSCGTISHHAVTYYVGQSHTITVRFTLQGHSDYGFVEAKLERR